MYPKDNCGVAVVEPSATAGKEKQQMTGLPKQNPEPPVLQAGFAAELSERREPREQPAPRAGGSLGPSEQRHVAPDPVPSWDCRAARCEWVFALVISKRGAGTVPLKTCPGTAFCAVTRWLEQPSARCCTAGTASTYPHLLWRPWALLGKRWTLAVVVHCVFRVSNPETGSRT